MRNEKSSVEFDFFVLDFPIYFYNMFLIWLQRHAHSSGLFYFRCPVCNNMEQFQQEMKRMGIYIPEQ